MFERIKLFAKVTKDLFTIEMDSSEEAKRIKALLNGISRAYNRGNAEEVMILSGQLHGMVIDGNEDLFNNFFAGMMEEADLKEVTGKRRKFIEGDFYVESEYKYYHENDEVLSISEFKKS